MIIILLYVILILAIIYCILRRIYVHMGITCDKTKVLEDTKDYNEIKRYVENTNDFTILEQDIVPTQLNADTSFLNPFTAQRSNFTVKPLVLYNDNNDYIRKYYESTIQSRKYVS